MAASINPAVRYSRLSTAYVRTVISPSFCLMAPNEAIGCPNCFRDAAYRAASPMASAAPPMHIAPSLNRPKFSTLNATLWPLPISPSRLPAGTRASWRISGVVDEPCSPILCSSLPVLTPGKAALDDEGGELLAVDLREDDEDVGESAVRDPHLLAVERVTAIARCVALALAPSASDPDPDSLSA